MGLEVVLVCAFLCMLQFHTGKSECNQIQLRFPASAINGNLQYTQFNPNCPYPLARNGNNICQTCKGSLCNNSCNSNNAISFKPSGKNVVLSFPSDKSPSGRISITIDTSPTPSKKAAPDVPPADNGETSKQNVDVLVKLIPKVGNTSTSTSGSSRATSDKNSEELAADTDGIIDIPGSNQAVDISVIVNDDNFGQAPKTTLDSDIIANNGNGEVSKTDTETVVNQTPDNVTPIDSSPDTPSPTPIPANTPASSDSSDSPVTGTQPKPDDSKPAPPAPTPSPGDTKSPEPKKETPGTPPPGNTNPSASSGAASGAAADDKTAVAGSASDATANSG